MNWLKQDPGFLPCIRSLQGFLDTNAGNRMIFTADSTWRRCEEFESRTDYEYSLSKLVKGALLALSLDRPNEPVGVSMDPYGSLWSEWLLPMLGWQPRMATDPEWSSAIREYACLFESDALDLKYAGACTTDDPEYTIRYCVDMVMNNIAPYSWLFSKIGGCVTVYFHNTASMGVCIPYGWEYDVVEFMRGAASLGLTRQS